MTVRVCRFFAGDAALAVCLLAVWAAPTGDSKADEAAPAPAPAAAAIEDLKARLKRELKAELAEEIRLELKAEILAEVKAQYAEAAKSQAEAVPPLVLAPALDLAALNFIERLPPSAFPLARERGIPGGSLATTFHGLQWPYFPKTGIGVSGYVWLDSGLEQIQRGNPAEQSIRYWLQQGRFVLRVTPTWTRGRFFVQGQAELVANKDQSQHQPDVVDTDDLWIRVGMWNLWDVQLGRYEGWEIYHFGMGLDLYTLERNGARDETFSVPSIYGVTYAFYRPAGLGQAALHLYPTKHLRFELGTQFGNEFGSNTLAARPVAILDYGWIRLKAGFEYKDSTDQKLGSKGETKERGLGAALQFTWYPHLEFGVSGAYGLADRTSQDGTIDEKGSNTTYSIGGFANARIVENLTVGTGVNYTYLWDLHYDPALRRPDRFNHTQAFGTVQYAIWNQLVVKVVAAYARANFAPTFGDPVFRNEMWSARVRLQYAF